MLEAAKIAWIFLIKFIDINLILAIFNLIPIPPLDGSRILMPFLPYKAQLWWNKAEPYGFVIIFFLMYIGVLSKIITIVYYPIKRLIM